MKSLESTARHLEATTIDRHHYTRLKQLREEIEALTFEKEGLELELKLRISENAGLQKLATWESKKSLRFDTAGFRASYPDLYQSFRKPTITRYFRLL